MSQRYSVLKRMRRLQPPVVGLVLGLAIAFVLAACAPATAPVSAPTTAPATAPTKAPAAASSPALAATANAASAKPTAPAQTLTLTGAGSSFDNPLFTKAFSEYTKLHPNVQVNYQSVGSGAGIQQLTQGTVDFGASDAPMTDDQMKAAPGPIVHVPVTLGAVSIAYNLPGVAAGLKLTGQVLANIYLGTITKWNDPAIAQLNPDLKLPASDIAVVYRSDGSGTSDIFTTYLSSVSPDWKGKVGFGTSVNWPTGIGAKGSEGVAGQVKQTPGGIGYFEMAYATQNNLTSASMDNGAGQFLQPSTDGASSCAASAQMPADLRVRIAGCSGQGVYPISGFSWVILYKDQKDPARGQATVNLLNWLVTDGQQYGPALGYAPLAASVVKLDQQQLAGITLAGKPAAPAGQ